MSSYECNYRLIAEEYYGNTSKWLISDLFTSFYWSVTF